MTNDKQAMIRPALLKAIADDDKAYLKQFITQTPPHAEVSQLWIYEQAIQYKHFKFLAALLKLNPHIIYQGADSLLFYNQLCPTALFIILSNVAVNDIPPPLYDYLAITLLQQYSPTHKMTKELEFIYQIVFNRCHLYNIPSFNLRKRPQEEARIASYSLLAYAVAVECSTAFTILLSRYQASDRAKLMEQLNHSQLQLKCYFGNCVTYDDYIMEARAYAEAHKKPFIYDGYVLYIENNSSSRNASKRNCLIIWHLPSNTCSKFPLDNSTTHTQLSVNLVWHYLKGYLPFSMKTSPLEPTAKQSIERDRHFYTLYQTVADENIARLTTIKTELTSLLFADPNNPLIIVKDLTTLLQRIPSIPHYWIIYEYREIKEQILAVLNNLNFDTMFDSKLPKLCHPIDDLLTVLKALKEGDDFMRPTFVLWELLQLKEGLSPNENTIDSPFADENLTLWIETYKRLYLSLSKIHVDKLEIFTPTEMKSLREINDFFVGKLNTHNLWRNRLIVQIHPFSTLLLSAEETRSPAEENLLRACKRFNKFIRLLKQQHYLDAWQYLKTYLNEYDQRIYHDFYNYYQLNQGMLQERKMLFTAKIDAIFSKDNSHSEVILAKTYSLLQQQINTVINELARTSHHSLPYLEHTQFIECLIHSKRELLLYCDNAIEAYLVQFTPTIRDSFRHEIQKAIVNRSICSLTADDLIDTRNQSKPPIGGWSLQLRLPTTNVTNVGYFSGTKQPANNKDNRAIRPAVEYAL